MYSYNGIISNSCRLSLLLQPPPTLFLFDMEDNVPWSACCIARQYCICTFHSYLVICSILSFPWTVHVGSTPLGVWNGLLMALLSHVLQYVAFSQYVRACLWRWQTKWHALEFLIFFSCVSSCGYVHTLVSESRVTAFICVSLYTCTCEGQTHALLYIVISLVCVCACVRDVCIYVCVHNY